MPANRQVFPPTVRIAEIPDRRMTPPGAAREAGVSPPLMMLRDVLDLQQTIGNRAVGRLLAAPPSGAMIQSRPNPSLNLVQRRTAAIRVDPAKHPAAVEQEPHDSDHDIGFRMPVSLTVDPGYGYAEVSDHLKFLQYVKDEYNVQDEDGSEILTGEYGDWELDSYGFESAKGNWETNANTTKWTDTPGFLGTHKLKAGQLLSKYEVKFYWTVEADQDQKVEEDEEDEEERGGRKRGKLTKRKEKEKKKQLHKTKEITLTAEAGDNDAITYTTESVNENIEVS
jgi:hypothetical protein